MTGRMPGAGFAWKSRVPRVKTRPNSRIARIDNRVGAGPLVFALTHGSISSEPGQEAPHGFHEA